MGISADLVSAQHRQKSQDEFHFFLEVLNTYSHVVIRSIWQPAPASITCRRKATGTSPDNELARAAAGSSEC